MSVSMIVATGGCKKAYKPSIVASNVNYLVVEGAINSGADSTFIKVSRTVNISDKTASKPDSEALVTIENDRQARFYGGSHPRFIPLGDATQAGASECVDCTLRVQISNRYFGNNRWRR